MSIKYILINIILTQVHAFTVSFVGDSGTDDNAIDVFDKMESTSTDILIHGGDLGYNQARKFKDIISGYSFPLITCYGEDDIPYDQYEYEQSFANDYISIISWLPYETVQYGEFNNDTINFCLFHLPRDMDLHFDVCSKNNATIINGNYHTYNRRIEDNIMILTIGTGGKVMHSPKTDKDYIKSFSEWGFISCRFPAKRCRFIASHYEILDEFEI